MPEPDLAQGLCALAAELDRHQEVDSATESAASLLGTFGLPLADARASGIQARVVTNNAFTHCPMDLSGEEKALVHAAIAGLIVVRTLFARVGPCTVPCTRQAGRSPESRTRTIS